MSDEDAEQVYSVPREIPPKRPLGILDASQIYSLFSTLSIAICEKIDDFIDQNDCLGPGIGLELIPRRVHSYWVPSNKNAKVIIDSDSVVRKGSSAAKLRLS